MHHSSRISVKSFFIVSFSYIFKNKVTLTNASLRHWKSTKCLQKKAINMQDRCQYERGQKLHHCLFSKGRLIHFYWENCFSFQLPLTQSSSKGEIIDRRSRKLGHWCFGEEQIACPQPLLLRTLKNIYFKSTNLKWQTWPNNIPLPLPCGHLSGHDFYEMVDTQKLWSDNFQAFS